MSDAIVAHQPIFDDRQRLVGFELLYRHAEDATAAVGSSSTAMASSAVVQAVLGIGFERLTERAVVCGACGGACVARDGRVLRPSAFVSALHGRCSTNRDASPR